MAAPVADSTGGRFWLPGTRREVDHKGVVLESSHPNNGSGPRRAPGAAAALPAWIADSPLLSRAQAIAAEAHGDARRATDEAPFLAHVTEVGALLSDAGCDETLVAAGLLHDAVERGTLTEAKLRTEMGDEISTLVLTLTEDRGISSFTERKRALRERVEAAGQRAIAVFAADKLSDIRGLRRGIDTGGDSIEARMGTTVDRMAGHYLESVAMIEESEPGLGVRRRAARRARFPRIDCCPGRVAAMKGTHDRDDQH